MVYSENQTNALSWCTAAIDRSNLAIVRVEGCQSPLSRRKDDNTPLSSDELYPFDGAGKKNELSGGGLSSRRKAKTIRKLAVKEPIVRKEQGPSFSENGTLCWKVLGPKALIYEIEKLGREFSGSTGKSGGQSDHEGANLALFHPWEIPSFRRGRQGKALRPDSISLRD